MSKRVSRGTVPSK